MKTLKIENKAKLAVLSDFNVCPTLTTNEREIIKARASKKLIEAVSEVESKRECFRIVEQALVKAIKAYGGNVPTGDKKEGLIVDVINAMKEYKWLRLSEIAIIFKKGAIGQLGDYVGVTPRTVSQWIMKYEEEYKRAAFKKQLAFEQEQNTKKDEERLEREAKQSSEKMKQELVNYYNELFAQYQEIKKEKEITWKQIPQEINPHNVHFQSFYDAGLLALDADKKRQMWEDCKKQIKSNEQLNLVLISSSLSNDEKQNRIDTASKNLYKDMLFRAKIAEWIMNDVESIEELLDSNNL